MDILRPGLMPPENTHVCQSCGGTANLGQL